MATSVTATRQRLHSQEGIADGLAPMDPAESFRLLRPGGYAVEAAWVDAHWQDFSQVFPKDRLITFPGTWSPRKHSFRQDSAMPNHTRGASPRPDLWEIITVIRYAPVLRDFDETADRPFLSKLEASYGEKDGIRLTEGELVIIGRKEDLG